MPTRGQYIAAAFFVFCVLVLTPVSLGTMHVLVQLPDGSLQCVQLSPEYPRLLLALAAFAALGIAKWREWGQLAGTLAAALWMERWGHWVDFDLQGTPLVAIWLATLLWLWLPGIHDRFARDCFCR